MAGKKQVTRTVRAWVMIVAAILVLAGLSSPAVLAQDDKPQIEVYGFVQADYIQDFDRVDPAWTDTLRPSKIPTVDGLLGEDGQAYLSAKQSRLGVMMNFPTSNKTVYTKFEFDMFGVGGDAGQTTIRLRHAYGQWGQWLAGQTNSLFMDAGIFPNVIDYWGPAGMVFLRNPQIRWTPFSGDHTFSVAIEKPLNDIDAASVRELDPGLGDIQGSQKVPDLTGQYHMKQKWGHLQFAGILRKVAFDTADTPDNEPKGSELGWGLDVTSGIKVREKDQVLLGVVYGEGIASYMNDGGIDLAPGGTIGDPNAEAVPLLGISAYYDCWWSTKFSSSFGVSQTKVDNTSLQSATSFQRGQYVSGNLLYYPTKNVFIGGEALWGQRKDNDGATGDDTRVQISFHFSFSSKDIMGLKRNED
jgi:outer membrane DcaP-like protein